MASACCVNVCAHEQHVDNPNPKYKYKYNSYFYCAPYSLTDGALQKSANTHTITAYSVSGNVVYVCAYSSVQLGKSRVEKEFSDYLTQCVVYRHRLTSCPPLPSASALRACKYCRDELSVDVTAVQPIYSAQVSHATARYTGPPVLPVLVCLSGVTSPSVSSQL